MNLSLHIGRHWCGASDVQRGYTLVTTPLLHPKTEVVKGIKGLECKALIDQFFKNIR